MYYRFTVPGNLRAQHNLFVEVQSRCIHGRIAATRRLSCGGSIDERYRDHRHRRRRRSRGKRDNEARERASKYEMHAPARITRARWHLTCGRRPSELVDGCKWRQPRSLWHGLANSSTPIVRPASEPCAQRNLRSDRYVPPANSASFVAIGRVRAP